MAPRPLRAAFLTPLAMLVGTDLDLTIIYYNLTVLQQEKGEKKEII
jgi:hypothetical protein